MKFKDISIPKKYIITGDYIDEIDFIKKLEAQILKGAQLITPFFNPKYFGECLEFMVDIFVSNF